MSLARKLRCTVEAIADHGGGVYTLDLKPAGGLPAFRPGQFLHLTVDAYDPSSFWPESRVFSIASSPTDKQRLRICYSVKGRYTTKMAHALRPGSEVWVKLPYGEFFIEDSADAVLLAGGTGVSAFTAFIEALPPAMPRNIWLVYGARHPGLLLFREMIERQLASVARFRLIYFTEEQTETLQAATVGHARPPECLSGRISSEAIFQRVPEAAQKVFYLSGPPIMLNALSGQLRERGVPAERVRTDAWE
jgi:ferredoxin-NADP reductase